MTFALNYTLFGLITDQNSQSHRCTQPILKTRTPITYNSFQSLRHNIFS